MDNEPVTVNPIYLNADAILKAAIWFDLSSSFESASRKLCSALASVGNHIATTLVNPDGLSAFVACRLIPIDKCPGVRPIGVGEVPRKSLLKLNGDYLVKT